MKKILIILLLITNYVFSQNLHIILGSNSYVVMKNGASITLDATNTDVFTVGSNSHFVSEEQNNKVYWKVFNGNYKVPFTDINANSVAISYNVSTPGSGNGFISFSTGPTDASQKMTSTGSYPTPITNVTNVYGTNDSSHMANRFWFVDYLNYTTNPTGTISLNYTDNDISGLNESMLQSQSWNNTINEWIRPPVGTVDMSNNVVSSIQSNNNATVWCVIDKNFPLPVELLSFDGNCKNNEYIEFEWITASEINNDYFTIEGSTDAITYSSLGKIEAYGNSNSIIKYSYTLKLNDNKYYRLRQTDYDGKLSVSNSISINCTQNRIKIYPNPSYVGDEIFIYGSYSKIKIYNSLGIEIKNMIIDNIIYGLPHGVYTVEVDNSYKIKLIVI